VGRRQIGGYRRFWSCSDRGAVLLEAAIITPLFVMLLFGIWTTARAWNIHNVLDHAAREAARYGAVDPLAGNIETIAEGEVLAASYPWTNVTFCTAVVENGMVTEADPGGLCINAVLDPTTDDRVQVSLAIPNYQLNFVFFTATVQLEARAVARLEP
jgi:Flp pilus assembly protein TadG